MVLNNFYTRDVQVYLQRSIVVYLSYKIVYVIIFITQ